MYLTAESLILVEKWECLHLNLHECGLPQTDADCKTGGGRGVMFIIEMHALVLEAVMLRARCEIVRSPLWMRVVG